MSQLTINTFSKFDQTEQEQLAGTHYTTEQLQFIQNQIASLAEQRLALTPDPERYNVFIQDEAHLKGQISAYMYLLDCHKATQDTLLDRAQAGNQ